MLSRTLARNNLLDAAVIPADITSHRCASAPYAAVARGLPFLITRKSSALRPTHCNPAPCGSGVSPTNVERRPERRPTCQADGVTTVPVVARSRRRRSNPEMRQDSVGGAHSEETSLLSHWCGFRPMPATDLDLSRRPRQSPARRLSLPRHLDHRLNAHQSFVNEVVAQTGDELDARKYLKRFGAGKGKR